MAERSVFILGGTGFIGWHTALGFGSGGLAAAITAGASVLDILGPNSRIA